MTNPSSTDNVRDFVTALSMAMECSPSDATCRVLMILRDRHDLLREILPPVAYRRLDDKYRVVEEAGKAMILPVPTQPPVGEPRKRVRTSPGKKERIGEHHHILWNGMARTMTIIDLTIELARKLVSQGLQNRVSEKWWRTEPLVRPRYANRTLNANLTREIVPGVYLYTAMSNHELLCRAAKIAVAMGDKVFLVMDESGSQIIPIDDTYR